jgi:hypothetical protein
MHSVGGMIYCQEYLGALTSKISITTDLWTGKNQKAYICITIHFIDDAWRLRNLLLDFSEFDGAHDGDNIARSIIGTLDDYGITHKVSLACSSAFFSPNWKFQILGVTTDNATNNGTAVEALESLLMERGYAWRSSLMHESHLEPCQQSCS